MKRVHLYDFSVPAAICALFVFPFMIYFFLSFFLYNGKVWGLIAAVLVLAGFIAVIYTFVLKAAVLDETGASYKTVHIPRGQLTVVSEYDSRFKEPVYLLRDVTKDYRGLDEKELAGVQIRVQATQANTGKLTDYTEKPLSPAKKPRYRWKNK